MTRNQIDAKTQLANQARDIKNLEEERRANKTKEKELHRSNRVRERETFRSNVAKELGNLIGIGAKAGGDAAKLASILGNHPVWYNLNKTLVDSAANLSFYTPLRGPIDLDGITVPRAAVMALNWVPAIGGDSTRAGSLRPIVTAAQNIYAWVRHANSGASNYEPNDLMMYMLSMDSAYTWYAFGRMIYRMCLSASSSDLTYPNAWFKACGINRDTFMANLADFRWFLESVALKLNVFFVPADFPYFDRHVWMVSNLFKDSNLTKTAYYYYAPDVYGLYDDLEGRIEFISRPNELTITNYRTAMTSILEHLYGSEDIGIISGDIKKAYGDSLFKIESTPIDDVAEPFYSIDVLQQINNTVLVGTLTAGSFDIYQVVGDQNSIFQGNATATTKVPRIVLPANATRIHSWIVNCNSDVPTVDDVMVITRNVTLTYTTSGATTEEVIDVAGSEIFTTANITVVSLDSDGNAQLRNITYHSQMNPITYELLSALSQMDWAPCGLVSSSTDKYGYLWDLENYAEVTSKQLGNIHATALLSEFYIPLEGLRNVGNKIPR